MCLGRHLQNAQLRGDSVFHGSVDICREVAGQGAFDFFQCSPGIGADFVDGVDNERFRQVGHITGLQKMAVLDFAAPVMTAGVDRYRKTHLPAFDLPGDQAWLHGEHVIFQRSALFVSAEHVQQLGCRDACDGFAANPGEKVPFKAADDAVGVTVRPVRRKARLFDGSLR